MSELGALSGHQRLIRRDGVTPLIYQYDDVTSLLRQSKILRLTSAARLVLGTHVHLANPAETGHVQRTRINARTRFRMAARWRFRLVTLFRRGEVVFGEEE